ncbi:hypothetical protein CBR_g20355 [Chara braunii]|uniref:Serpin domain-containing protein n=1 Tax=Chara braunii TaxID=69332 RepID=A0A388JU65_CHABU|nr:hypothetical protein CBR_g20355 [Chara braunii]|eukprot:GBG61320.1 hypothetical protein CBR_g20355 [Chara braunii]
MSFRGSCLGKKPETEKARQDRHSSHFIRQQMAGSQCYSQCSKGVQYGKPCLERLLFVIILVVANLKASEANASLFLPPDRILQVGKDVTTHENGHHDRQGVVSWVHRPELREGRRMELAEVYDKLSSDDNGEGRMVDSGHAASHLFREGTKHRELRTHASYRRPTRPLRTLASLDPPNSSSTLTARGMTKLAVSMVQAINSKTNFSANGSTNVVFSPLSVFTVLAMLSGGVDGNTLSQLLTALNASDVYQLSDAVGRMLLQAANDSNASQGKGGQRTMLFELANNLWVQNRFPLTDRFVNLTNSTYHAVPQVVDFSVDAEAIRQTINAWVSNVTHGKILDLLPVGSLSSLTRVVLANALYFKAVWADKFNQSLTEPGPFMLSSQTSVDVPMMKMKDLHGSVHSMCNKEGSAGTFSVLRLPYRVGTENELQGVGMSGWDMYIFLPERVDGLADLVAELTPEQLSTCLSISSSLDSEVWISELRMPRFRLTSDALLLSDTFKSMGIVDAFDPLSANFAAMTNSTESLFVSEVYHKAYVEVNEEGSEAAAATSIIVSTLAAGPPVISVSFIVDHPFLFIIQDPLGNIIIMGQVQNPSL